MESRVSLPELICVLIANLQRLKLCQFAVLSYVEPVRSVLSQVHKESVLCSLLLRNQFVARISFEKS
jgi:hypothetical protein